MEKNTKSVQWEILTSLSLIFDSGDVTWPSLFLEIVIVWSYATENFPALFSWSNSLRWCSSWWWILSLVIHEKRFFLISDTGSSEEKIWVEPVNSPNVSGLVIGQTPSCCENSNFLFRVTCVIIKHSFSQNNAASSKAKIPVRSDPIRSAVRSDPSK